MITTLIAAVRKKLDDRRRYARVVAEIEKLSNRKLADLRADPSELMRHARIEIFGEAD